MRRQNTLSSMFRPLHLLGQWLTSVLLLAGLCGVPTAQAQARYSYSADGSEVTDSKTGLIWRRCSEGQSWSAGTCSGAAATYTHEQALVQAQTQTGWRLPNIKELSSITDKSHINLAIDVTAFPATPPSSWFWSSTPYVKDASKAWDVDFYDGYASGDLRSNSYHVRLVR